MGRGGAREGTGPKPKWEGRKIKLKRVPADVPEQLIDRWLSILVELDKQGMDVNNMTVEEITKAYFKS